MISGTDNQSYQDIIKRREENTIKKSNLQTFYSIMSYSRLLHIGEVQSSHRRCSVKKAVLKNFTNFTGKPLCWSLFLINFQAFRRATPAQVFSCEICEIFKNTYFKEHLRTTAARVKQRRSFVWQRHCQISTFLKTVKDFCKKLHLRCLIRF